MIRPKPRAATPPNASGAATGGEGASLLAVLKRGDRVPGTMGQWWIEQEIKRGEKHSKGENR